MSDCVYSLQIANAQQSTRCVALVLRHERLPLCRGSFIELTLPDEAQADARPLLFQIGLEGLAPPVQQTQQPSRSGSQHNLVSVLSAEQTLTFDDKPDTDAAAVQLSLELPTTITRPAQQYVFRPLSLRLSPSLSVS